LSINQANEKLLYSRNEAAEQLRLTTRSVDDMIKSGKLASVRFGRRVFVPAGALHELASNGHSGRLRPKY